MKNQLRVSLTTLQDICLDCSDNLKAIEILNLLCENCPVQKLKNKKIQEIIAEANYGK